MDPLSLLRVYQGDIEVVGQTEHNMNDLNIGALCNTKEEGEKVRPPPRPPRSPSSPQSVCPLSFPSPAVSHRNFSRLSLDTTLLRVRARRSPSRTTPHTTELSAQCSCCLTMRPLPSHLHVQCNGTA